METMSGQRNILLELYARLHPEIVPNKITLHDYKGFTATIDVSKNLRDKDQEKAISFKENAIKFNNMAKVKLEKIVSYDPESLKNAHMRQKNIIKEGINLLYYGTEKRSMEMDKPKEDMGTISSILVPTSPSWRSWAHMMETIAGVSKFYGLGNNEKLRELEACDELKNTVDELRTYSKNIDESIKEADLTIVQTFRLIRDYDPRMEELKVTPIDKSLEKVDPSTPMGRLVQTNLELNVKLAQEKKKNTDLILDFENLLRSYTSLRDASLEVMEKIHTARETVKRETDPTYRNNLIEMGIIDSDGNILDSTTGKKRSRSGESIPFSNLSVLMNENLGSMKILEKEHSKLSLESIKDAIQKYKDKHTWLDFDKNYVKVLKETSDGLGNVFTIISNERTTILKRSHSIITEMKKNISTVLNDYLMNSTDLAVNPRQLKNFWEEFTSKYDITRTLLKKTPNRPVDPDMNTPLEVSRFLVKAARYVNGDLMKVFIKDVYKQSKKIMDEATRDVRNSLMTYIVNSNGYTSEIEKLVNSYKEYKIHFKDYEWSDIIMIEAENIPDENDTLPTVVISLQTYLKSITQNVLGPVRRDVMEKMLTEIKTWETTLRNSIGNILSPSGNYNPPIASIRNAYKKYIKIFPSEGTEVSDILIGEYLSYESTETIEKLIKTNSEMFNNITAGMDTFLDTVRTAFKKLYQLKDIVGVNVVNNVETQRHYIDLMIETLNNHLITKASNVRSLFESGDKPDIITNFEEIGYPSSMEKNMKKISLESLETIKLPGTHAHRRNTQKLPDINEIKKAIKESVTVYTTQNEEMSKLSKWMISDRNVLNEALIMMRQAFAVADTGTDPFTRLYTVINNKFGITYTNDENTMMYPLQQAFRHLPLFISSYQKKSLSEIAIFLHEIPDGVNNTLDRMITFFDYLSKEVHKMMESSKIAEENLKLSKKKSDEDVSINRIRTENESLKTKNLNLKEYYTYFNAIIQKITEGEFSFIKIDFDEVDPKIGIENGLTFGIWYTSLMKKNTDRLAENVQFRYDKFGLPDQDVIDEMKKWGDEFTKVYNKFSNIKTMIENELPDDSKSVIQKKLYGLTEQFDKQAVELIDLILLPSKSLNPSIHLGDNDYDLKTRSLQLLLNQKEYGMLIEVYGRLVQNADAKCPTVEDITKETEENATNRTVQKDDESRNLIQCIYEKCDGRLKSDEEAKRKSEEKPEEKTEKKKKRISFNQKNAQEKSWSESEKTLEDVLGLL